MDVISSQWVDDHRLGYGTAYLLDGRDRAAAVRLLDAAIDEGLRYFDTARMYCQGEAESVVGDVLRRRRDKMFVATKAGILPPSGSFAAKVARKIAAKGGVSAPAFARAPDHCFSPAQLAASVETSLSRLGTDRIDLLLLHEVAPQDITDEVLALLDAMTADGRVAAFGLATGRTETRAIGARFPGVFSFAQVPDSIWLRQEASPAITGIATVGSHSLLGPRFSALMRRLHADAVESRHWQDQLGFDPRQGGRLAHLFLAEALDANPHGPVLFSSGNIQNIRANMALLDGGPAALPVAALRRLLSGQTAGHGVSARPAVHA